LRKPAISAALTGGDPIPKYRCEPMFRMAPHLITFALVAVVAGLSPLVADEEEEAPAATQVP